jgi:uncharacterized protein (UPF0332 family)
MQNLADVFLVKAEESLAGAESEFANGRYNNCANRCYYACFQAAIAALLRAGIQPSGDQWSHTFVQGQFVGQLINWRKVYSGELRDVLSRTQLLRQTADYEYEQVTEVQAYRALRRARQFLAAIRGGEKR